MQAGRSTYGMFDVFISYSSKDKTTADAICAILEKYKVRCWIAPRDVLPGTAYGEAILDGINTSQMMVVVLSTASNASQHVLREVERAVSKGIPIIPFRIEDIKPSKSMEFFLSTPHWLDALSKPLEAHIERLSVVVRAVLEPGRRRTNVNSPGDAKPSSGHFDDFAVTHPSVLRETLGLIQRKVVQSFGRWKFAILGAGLVLILLMIVMLSARPVALEAEYRVYQKNVREARGSVVFLKDAAPNRYTSWLARAEAGDPIAQLFVGRCYQEGFVAKVDKNMAITWLDKSAAQGNDYAMLTLGLAYEQGEGVTADPAQVIRWYTSAAERGNTAAMRSLGNVLAEGRANNKLELAYNWYRKAADAGDPVAMRFVGNCYLNGSGVTKDVAESDRWYQKAANAGDPYTVGKRFGDRLGPHFAAYLAAGATEASRSAALASIRDLEPEFQQLALDEQSWCFFASNFQVARGGVEELPKDDPLLALFDVMVQRYADIFAASSSVKRTDYMASMSALTASLVGRWFADHRYDEVAAFWDRLYKDVPLSKLSTGGEIDQVVRQINWAISSMYRTGNRKEAAELLQVALQLCDASLKDRPWDWYAKDAYTGLCFNTAEVLDELGESSEAQPLLRRGWSVRLRQYGKEALFNQYSELPLKGKVPANANEEDRKFFESFGPNADKKNSGMKRFTVPCDFAGTKYPFHLYVIRGPRGYIELQDQFRWLKEMRGGEVPAEVRASFLRLNRIAAENKVDFMELCVYALGTESKETPDQAKPEADKN